MVCGLAFVRCCSWGCCEYCGCGAGERRVTPAVECMSSWSPSAREWSLDERHQVVSGMRCELPFLSRPGMRIIVIPIRQV